MENEGKTDITQAFRPGNVDLPAGAISHSTAQLTLPDVITELDLLLPDPTLDLGGLGDLPLHAGHQRRNADITLDADSFIGSMEQQPRAYDRDDDLQLEDEILDIDIGEDRDMAVGGGGLDDLITGSDSMEIGRDAPLGRDIADDLFDDSRMSLDLGLETPKARESLPPALSFEDDLDLGLDDENMGFGRGMDIDFDGGDTTTIQAREATTPPPPSATAHEAVVAAADAADAAGAAVSGPEPLPARERSESPLSSVRSSVGRQLSADLEHEQQQQSGEAGDATFQPNEDSMRLPSEDVETAHANQQASRKRKVLVDPATEIKAKVIKAQQTDRARILQQPSFLPRDPAVLALMSLTRSGGLAHSMFYPKNMAPELSRLLAPDFVKRMADLKRKRAAGGGGGGGQGREDGEEGEEEEEEEEEATRPSPPKQARLEIEDEEDRGRHRHHRHRDQEDEEDEEEDENENEHPEGKGKDGRGGEGKGRGSKGREGEGKWEEEEDRGEEEAHAHVERQGAGEEEMLEFPAVEAAMAAPGDETDYALPQAREGLAHAPCSMNPCPNTEMQAHSPPSPTFSPRERLRPKRRRPWGSRRRRKPWFGLPSPSRVKRGTRCTCCANSSPSPAARPLSGSTSSSHRRRRPRQTPPRCSLRSSCWPPRMPSGSSSMTGPLGGSRCSRRRRCGEPGPKRRTSSRWLRTRSGSARRPIGRLAALGKSWWAPAGTEASPRLPYSLFYYSFPFSFLLYSFSFPCFLSSWKRTDRRYRSCAVLGGCCRLCLIIAVPRIGSRVVCAGKLQKLTLLYTRR